MNDKKPKYTSILGIMILTILVVFGIVATALTTLQSESEKWIDQWGEGVVYYDIISETQHNETAFGVNYTYYEYELERNEDILNIVTPHKFNGTQMQVVIYKIPERCAYNTFWSFAYQITHPLEAF